MALNPSFTIGVTIDPSAIVLNDNSTGSDPSVASRRISLYLTSQQLLVPVIPWALAQNPITINPLTQDVALNIQVDWLDSGGGVLYTVANIFVFTGYSELFMYGLTQEQSAQPDIVNDRNYYSNKEQLRCELDASVKAIEVGQDIFAAQNCLNRALNMIKNKNNYF